jgi:hypothetical protein
VIWLGDKRGNLSDWVTQCWVKATGRRVSLEQKPWLAGPAGSPQGIGRHFFATYATERNLEIVQTGVRGLIPDFSRLTSGNPATAEIAESVKQFYELTSEFDLDVWPEWNGFFRPFGVALRFIFSSRLQQLNLPLSPLDTARGMTSEVIQMRDPASGRVLETAWVRELHATRNVLYAGSYSVCTVPGHASPCVKVVFPLPNGNVIVIMKAVVEADGSLRLSSSGRSFGDPGLYFTVHTNAPAVSARYLPSLKEEIHVYQAEPGSVRTDHTLWIWGIKFLRLHYRMRRQVKSASSDASSSVA